MNAGLERTQTASIIKDKTQKTHINYCVDTKKRALCSGFYGNVPLFCCSKTRFRWIQDSPNGAAPGWALDEIYVGEACQEMCNGKGDCRDGKCHCDIGYRGNMNNRFNCLSK